MSLFITFESGAEREFWIQDLEKPGVRTYLHGMASGVSSVQADGDELDLIRKQFTNIPEAGKRVQRWFGDHARFIVGNL